MVCCVNAPERFPAELRAKSARINDAHVFGSCLVMELKAGVSRQKWQGLHGATGEGVGVCAIVVLSIVISMDITNSATRTNTGGRLPLSSRQVRS